MYWRVSTTIFCLVVIGICGNIATTSKHAPNPKVGQASPFFTSGKTPQLIHQKDSQGVQLEERTTQTSEGAHSTDCNRVGDTLHPDRRNERRLQSKSDDNNEDKRQSPLENSLFQAGVEFLRGIDIKLYYDVFQNTFSGISTRDFGLLYSSSYIKRLSYTNPLVGTLVNSTDYRRRALKLIEKAVGKEHPSDLLMWEKEVERVTKAMQKIPELRSEYHPDDAFQKGATKHLIYSIREARSKDSSDVKPEVTICCISDMEQARFIWHGKACCDLKYFLHVLAEKRVVLVEKVGKCCCSFSGVGLSGIVEALRRDAVLTVAHTLQYLTSRLKLSFRSLVQKRSGLLKGCLQVTMQVQQWAFLPIMAPGGIIGLILRTILRMYNLLFFPALVSVTSAFAVALGMACLIGIPVVFAKVFDYIDRQVKTGVRKLHFAKQLFHLRNDAVGKELLRSSVYNTIPKLLSTLWKIEALDVEAFSSFSESHPVMGSGAFSDSFLSGAIGFAQGFSEYLETEYLTRFEDEGMQCYSQKVFLDAAKVECENVFRRTERFAEGVKNLTVFVDWQSFRHYVADLLHMMYNAARVALEADIKSQSLGPKQLKREIKQITKREKITDHVLKSILRREAHRLTTAVVNLTTFFQLRKLHEWKPQRRHDHTGVLLSRQETTDKWQSNVDEDISLVNASHFMFSDLELPPELAIASLSPTKLTNDITSTAHLALLRRFQKTRDQKMIRMLRSAINKLIGVVKGLIGRFKNLVEFAMNKKTIEVCTVVDRHLCANNDGFKEATFLVLEFIVAAHLGVYMSREGRPSVRLQDIQEDFIQFISEVSWFRYRPRGVHLFKRKPRWSLDELAAYLFPYGNNKRKDVPFSPEEMDLLRKAVISSHEKARAFLEKRMRVVRLRCISRAKFLIFTTEAGERKIFKPSTVITDTTRRRLCTPEHDLIHFNGVFELKDVGGELLAPGSQRIAGLIIDAQDIVTDMEQEASMNTLIQTIFWSKGYRRIDAQMVADVIVAAKHMLYSNLSWKEFLVKVTPADLNDAQDLLADGTMLASDEFRSDSEVSLYSFELSKQNILSIIGDTAKTLLLTNGALKVGLDDLALLSMGHFFLSIVNKIERNVTGRTRLLERFQNILWDEYERQKGRSSREKSIHRHVAVVEKPAIDSGSRTLNSQPTTGASLGHAASDAFLLREDGSSVVEDWCEELYKDQNPVSPAAELANISAFEAAVVRCSLLRFLSKNTREQTLFDVANSKAAVFLYLNSVLHELRRMKRNDKYSWKTYLNAVPPRMGEADEKVRSIAKKFLQMAKRFKHRVKHKGLRVAHKVRSEGAKSFFGQRLLNSLRGDLFLQCLYTASVKSFPDLKLYPNTFLISPATLHSFSKISSILVVDVEPIIDSPEAAQLIMQSKMIPVPSIAMRGQLDRLETALASLKTDLGDGYQKRVRQCAGFLSLLQMLKAAPKYASPYSAAMFLRKAAFVREPAEKQGSHLLLDRKIGFLEVENVKLMEATLRGIEMIEKLVKSVQGTKSDTEILNQRVFSINSNQLSSGWQFPYHLGNPRVLLFCNVSVISGHLPRYKSIRENAIRQVTDLATVIGEAQDAVYFWQPDKPGEENSIPVPKFSGITSLLRELKDLRDQLPTSGSVQTNYSFYLSIPLLEGLETIGLGLDSGIAELSMPLQCGLPGVATVMAFADSGARSLDILPANLDVWMQTVISILMQFSDAREAAESLDPGVSASVSEDGGGEDGLGSLVPRQLSEAREASQSLKSISETATEEDTGEEGNTGDSLLNTTQGTVLLDLTAYQESNRKTSSATQENPTNMRYYADAVSQGAVVSPPTVERKEILQQDPKTDEISEFYLKKDEFGKQGEENAKLTMNHFKEQFDAPGHHVEIFLDLFHMLYPLVAKTGYFKSKLSQQVFAKLRDTLPASSKVSTVNTKAPFLLASPPQNNRRHFRSTPGVVSSFMLPATFEGLFKILSREQRELQRQQIKYVIQEGCKHEVRALFKNSLIQGKDVEQLDQRLLPYSKQPGKRNKRAADDSPVPASVVEGFSKRIATCSSPIWLDLKMRLYSEERIASANEFIPTIVRMGIYNARLLIETVDEALFDVLFAQLSDRGLILSPRAAISTLLKNATSLRPLTRESLKTALQSITARQPILHLGEAEEFVLDLFEILKRTRPSFSFVKKKLIHWKTKLLEDAAAHILAEAINWQVSEDDLELATVFLRRVRKTPHFNRNEKVLPNATHDSPASPLTHHVRRKATPESDTRAEGNIDGSYAENKPLDNWMTLNKAVSDPFLMLTRPNMINPTLLLIEIIGEIERPSRRRQRKKATQAGTITLEALDRLSCHLKSAHPVERQVSILANRKSGTDDRYLRNALEFQHASGVKLSSLDVLDE